MSNEAYGLWQTFHDANEPGTTRAQAREQLILHYTSLVRYVAWRLAAKLASNVEREDLVSYGVFGLIDAVDAFRPEMGVPFKNYAIPRIHGSMIDELRTMDWAPRSVRARERALLKAMETLEHSLLRPATGEELARELGWSHREVRIIQGELDRRYVRSIDEAGRDTGEQSSARSSRYDALDRADLALVDPDLEMEVERTRDLLALAAGRLPERERAVAAMYWRGGTCPPCEGLGGECRRCEGYGTVPGLTLGEIGNVLGISESWACQLYTNAATLLREYVAQG